MLWGEGEERGAKFKTRVTLVLHLAGWWPSLKEEGGLLTPGGLFAQHRLSPGHFAPPGHQTIIHSCSRDSPEQSPTHVT